MRGEDSQNHMLFSYVRPDSRIPPSHPIRLIRRVTDAALTALSDQFDKAYATEGRPSIPPERLLRALLIQALYSVRSERQLMEQLNCNLLFRWFVGLSVDEPVWDPSTFSKNPCSLASILTIRGFTATVHDTARHGAASCLPRHEPPASQRSTSPGRKRSWRPTRTQASRPLPISRWSVRVETLARSASSGSVTSLPPGSGAGGPGGAARLIGPLPRAGRGSPRAKAGTRRAPGIPRRSRSPWKRPWRSASGPARGAGRMRATRRGHRMTGAKPFSKGVVLEH